MAAVSDEALALAYATAAGCVAVTVWHCGCLDEDNGDSCVPPPVPSAEAAVRSASPPAARTCTTDRRPQLLPQPPPVGRLGLPQGPVEQVGDDLLLLVFHHLVQSVPGDARVAAASSDPRPRHLLAAGGTCRRWRRLCGLRCFWEPLCVRHFQMHTGEPNPLPVPTQAGAVASTAAAAVAGAGASSARDRGSLYAALGLSDDATSAEVVRAYRALSRSAQQVAGDASGGDHTELSRWRDAWLDWSSEAKHKMLPSTWSQHCNAPMWAHVNRYWHSIYAFFGDGARAADGRGAPSHSQQMIPQVIDSLLPPAEPVAWWHFLEHLEMRPYAAALEPLRLLFRVHNGQSTALDRLVDNGRVSGRKLLSRQCDLFVGLFGGWGAEGSLLRENGQLRGTSLRLYSLERMVHATKTLRTRLGQGNLALPPSMFVLGASLERQKMLLCDAASRMQLHFLTPNGLWAAHPPLPDPAATRRGGWGPRPAAVVRH
jgi:hypothetical protein